MAEGRRERMRNKIRSRGIEGLPPHEVVEFLLYPFLPRKDTSPLAKTLLNEFGGVDNLFSAREEDLLRIPGMPKMAALTFPIYKELIERAKLDSVMNKNIQVNSPSQVGNYCIRLLDGCRNERVIAIFSNSLGNVLGQKIISDGDSSGSVIDFNLVLRGALNFNAKCVVLSHNHPNGSLKPSSDDLRVTDNLKTFLENVGITLIDHIIVAEGEYVSILRDNKTMIE